MKWLFLALCACAGPIDVYTYSPAPELLPATELAISRLEQASGLDFHIGNGVELRALPAMSKCAYTHVEYAPGGDIEDTHINVAYPVPAECYADLSLTIAHEIIHVVRGDKNNDGHAADGLFAATPEHEAGITEATLTALCEAAPCTKFEPETP